MEYKRWRFLEYKPKPRFAFQSLSGVMLEQSIIQKGAKMQKVWKWLNHNRWAVICPIVGIMLWSYALGCMALTTSPLDVSRMVNASQLEIDFKTWQAQQEITAAKFEAAG